MSSNRQAGLIEPVAVTFDPPTTITTWLTQQAAKYNLRWLLAHSDDGVTWGEVRSPGGVPQLQTGHEFFAKFSPELNEQTLQQARLFGPLGELLLWRDGGAWRSRVIINDQDADFEDEDHLLWGDRCDDQQGGFLLMREGEEGLRHTPPAPAEGLRTSQELYLTLRVRHYVDYDQDGVAFWAMSRLVQLGLFGPTVHQANQGGN